MAAKRDQRLGARVVVETVKLLKRELTARLKILRPQRGGADDVCKERQAGQQIAGSRRGGVARVIQPRRALAL